MSDDYSILQLQNSRKILVDTITIATNTTQTLDIQKTQLLNIKQKTEDTDVNINIANRIVNRIRRYNIQRKYIYVLLIIILLFVICILLWLISKK